MFIADLTIKKRAARKRPPLGKWGIYEPLRNLAVAETTHIAFIHAERHV